MKNTIKTILSGFLGLSMCAGVQAADVVIGVPNWVSVNAMAHILKVVLEDNLGVEVELQNATNPIVFEAMDKGTMHVHPEVWLPNQANLYHTYVEEKGSVVQNPNAVISFQGMCVSKATAEQHGVTAITHLTDPDKAALFDSDGDGRGEIWIGATGWASTNVEKIRAKSYGYDQTLEINAPIVQFQREFRGQVVGYPGGNGRGFLTVKILVAACDADGIDRIAGDIARVDRVDQRSESLQFSRCAERRTNAGAQEQVVRRGIENAQLGIDGVITRVVILQAAGELDFESRRREPAQFHEASVNRGFALEIGKGFVEECESAGVGDRVIVIGKRLFTPLGSKGKAQRIRQRAGDRDLERGQLRTGIVDQRHEERVQQRRVVEFRIAFRCQQ